MYDITYHTHLISYPLYLWHPIYHVWQHNNVYCCYHTRHMCDIICTTDDIIFPPITPNHSVCHGMSTSGMTSQPLYQTSHQLYLFHHNISNAVTPTFLWQHTHYICDIICTIYYIISTTFMTSDLLYMRSHPKFITSHPLYMWHHNHYIGNITPTMSVNTYQLYLTWNTLC